MATGICSLEGCEKYGVLTRGWCYMHYRRWRMHGSHDLPERESLQCSVDGCTAPGRISNGYCGRHLYRVKKYGDPGPAERVYRRPAAPGSLCEIEGCGRGGLLRHGWCNLHYLRWKQHGDPHWEPPKTPDSCSIDGCDREHQARGLCGTHYVRQWRHGTTDDPAPYEPLPPQSCRVEGCGRVERLRAGLYCKTHYDRFLRHGDPTVLLRVREEKTSDTCTVGGCAAPWHAKGRCLPHYSAWRYEENREVVNERMRQHYRANRDSYFTRSQARRQRVAAISTEDREYSTGYRQAIAADPCTYCGAPGQHVDHFFPLAKGGTDHWWNLRRACGLCNRRKAAHCGTWFLLSGKVGVRADPVNESHGRMTA